MKAGLTSNNVYWLMVVVLTVVSAVSVFLPMGSMVENLPGAEMPSSKTLMALGTAGLMVVVYGGLGWLGLFLWRRLGYPDILDAVISQRQRLIRPAIIGALCGLALVVLDLVFSRWSPAGKLAHPPFPTSLTASVTAGIGEEIFFRLFFISFWVWLVSEVLLQGKGQDTVFVIAALVSAVMFAVAHLPSLMFLYGWQTIVQVPLIVLVELLLMNGLIALAAAFNMRQYGFLAAVGIHFWADIVWHVIYGLLG